MIRFRATASPALAAAVLLALAPAPAAAQLFGFRPDRDVQTPCPPTAAVLDFSQAPRAVEGRDECRDLKFTETRVTTGKDRRGWYLGAQNTYHNANSGQIMSDLVSDALRDSKRFTLKSRPDIKLYYQDKKDKLRAKFKDMKEADLDDALLALNPVSIGREMGVDKVIVGQVVDVETRHNRTFGFFAAVASVNMSVYDCHTGQLEFTKDYSSFRSRSTTYANLEKVAEEFVRAVDATQGVRMVPKWNDRRK